MLDLLLKRDAVISECGQYRYRLSRHWNVGPEATFIMLNPSTADAEADDATIRKCIGFAQRWGMGGLYVGNLFALRATDPKEMRKHRAPVGYQNRYHLEWICDRAAMSGGRIICAWGANGGHQKQDKTFCEWFESLDLFCLRRTSKGAPEHPLYVPYDTQPTPFV